MKVQNARIDQVQYIHLGISLAILCLIVPECPSLAYGKAKDVVRVARLSNSKRGNVCSRCGNIRKMSKTYVGYIDLYRSIGRLGYPSLYWS